MKNIQLITLLFIIGILTACNQGSQQVKTNKFSGLWTLHIIEQQDSITKEWSEYGGGLQGYILYDEKDNMAVHLTAKGYQNTDIIFHNFIDTVSIEELKYRTQSYVYFAKYTVNEEDKIIEHARISHSNPNEWNMVVKRRYEFIGDTLKLTTLENPDSPLRVTWVK